MLYETHTRICNKRMLIAQDYAKFRGRIAWQIFKKTTLLISQMKYGVTESRFGSVITGGIWNSPISHSTHHQRPARERHKIRNASRENVNNQALRNTNFTH